MKSRLPIIPINNEGFTLLEVLLVVFMLAILMAIGLPSWIVMLEGQRLNNAQAQVMDSLRATQTKAKQTKTVKTITFNTTAAPPNIEYLSKTETLGNGEIPAGSIIMTVDNDENVNEIQFEGQYGNVASSNILPFKVTVSTQGGRKKCVIVQTILGAMRTAENTECD